MENSDARAFRLVRCPRCLHVLREPAGSVVYQCGGCGSTLRVKIRTGSTEESAGASSRKGRDESANPEVSDISEAREQSWSSDAERSATSPGGCVHLTKGSNDSTSELQNETKKTSKGQADLLDAATCTIQVKWQRKRYSAITKNLYPNQLKPHNLHEMCRERKMMPPPLLLPEERCRSFKQKTWVPCGISRCSRQRMISRSGF